MFRPNKNKERKFIEIVDMPERIIIICTIVVFLLVVILCVAKLLFGTQDTQEITPDDFTEFSHKSDFNKNVYGEIQTPNMENIPSDPNDPTPISCWGDSFTISPDYATPSYVAYMSKNAVRLCYNLGINEGNIEDIAARQGGVPLYVAPVDIPARMTYKEIAISNSYGYEPNIDFEKNSGLNPCKIDGIEGLISQFDGTYKFTRSSSGFEHFVLKPTPIVTKAMELRKNDITIFFIGNTSNLADDAKTVEIYKKMAEFLDTDKYLVVGPIVGDLNKINSINTALASAFGNKFLNLYNYLYNDAQNEYKITINEKDKASIAAGNIPANFVQNRKGFSKQGAEIVGKKVSDTLSSLGYYE